MKQKCLLLSVFIAVSTICVAQPSFKAGLMFEVKNDEGEPIRGVPITVSTFDHVEPGELSGRQVYKVTSGHTDTNGQALLKAMTRTGEFSYHIGNISGYYDTGGTFSLLKVVNNRWQPEQSVVKVVLRQIVKPVPMYARKVETRIAKPAQAYDYDLLAGDWVAPYGKGKTADVFFELTGYANSVKDYDSMLTISFTNALDGIQPFEAIKGSVFRSPREAPLDGYQNSLGRVNTKP